LCVAGAFPAYSGSTLRARLIGLRGDRRRAQRRRRCIPIPGDELMESDNLNARPNRRSRQAHRASAAGRALVNEPIAGENRSRVN
jgi:hypothetical protein